jgi:hypothetical protein
LAKHKLEDNWPASLSKAIMKMEGFSDVGWGEKFGVKKENKFPHKKACHEGEWNHGQDISKREIQNNFKARVLNLKEILSRKGLF